MKKLLIIITIGLLAFGTSLSLEPIRVSVFAPQFEVGTGTANNITVVLRNTNNGNAVFTSDVRNGLNSDDSGILTFQIGLLNVGGAPTEFDRWSSIASTSVTPSYALQVYEGATLLNQVAISQQIINQANTSVFVGGVLLPPSSTATIGDDNNRFQDIFVQENSVHIGPAGGFAGSTELELSYDLANNTGDVVVDGIEVMSVSNSSVDFNQFDILNPTDINNTSAPLTINASNQAINLQGAFNANQDNNIIGNATNGKKLTVNGVPTLTPITPLSTDYEVTINGDLEILGNTKVNFLQLTGDLNMDDNDIFHVDEIRGNSTDSDLRINVTANVGNSIVGNTIFGDGDFTVGSAATTGASTFNGDITLGSDNTDEIAAIGEFTTNIVPDANNNNTLGTDAQRWASVFVNGASVHIGDANGAANSDEVAIRYNGSNVGSIAVGDGTSNANPQFAINATTGTDAITLDPAADATANFTFTEANATVNTAGGTDLVVTEGGMNRNLATDETFAFANGLAGNLNVTMDGDLNVAEQITGPNVGHSLGTVATDGTVLTVSGTPNTATYELVVDGDVDINGDLNVDNQISAANSGHTFGTSPTDANVVTISGLPNTATYELIVDGDVDINGDLNVDNQISAANSGHTYGTVGTDANVTTISGTANGGAYELDVVGDVQIDGLLNADGNTTLNANTTLGDNLATDLTTFNSKVNSDIVPNGNNAFALGSNAERWSALWVDGNAVHIGDVSGDNSAELEILYNTDVATLNVDGATNSQFTIDAANDLVSINASDDAVAELTIDPTDAAVGFIVNSNSLTGAEIISNASGIFLDVDGDGTNNFSSNNTAITLNATDDANNEIEVNGTSVTIDGGSNGSDNFIFEDTQATINTGGGVNLIVTEQGVNRNDAANQTFSFANSDATPGANLDVNIDGNINVQDNGSTIGDGTDAIQLRIEGDASGPNLDFELEGDGNVNGDFDIDETLNVDGNTTLNEDVTLGNNLATDLTTFNSKVNSDIVPNGDNAHGLGSDAERWDNVWVNGGSVHIGDANGDNTAELQIGYNNTGTIANLNVNNVDVQTMTPTQVTFPVNVDANLGLDVTGANLTVATPALFTVNGTTGVLTSTAAGNSIGATTNATQLTINGVAGGANELVVTGDAQTTGNLDVQGNTTLGDLATADVVTFNSRVNTDINPSTDNTNDLGTSALRWNDINLGGNATIGGQARFTEDDGNGTEYVSFQAPAALAGINAYTLPATFPTQTGQALISTTAGVMSWGGVTLQAAYNAGNTINTDNGVVNNQDIVFTGTGERFDIQLPMVNTSGSAPVQVNDADGFIVNSGLTTASNGLTVGSAGLTTINGGLLVQTGNSNFNSDITATADFIASGSDVQLGNGASTGSLQLRNSPAQLTGTSWSSYANVIVVTIQNGATYEDTGGTFNLNANHPNGAVVHVYFEGASTAIVTLSNGDSQAIDGGDAVTLMKASDGNWRLIGFRSN